MNISKYNAEGYYDSTAYLALTNIQREERRTYQPMVFICSPFAGDTEHNIRCAQNYCRYAVSKNRIPFAPHLLFPQFMDDSDPEQRKLALHFGMRFMNKCTEVWAFGKNISKGMRVEIDRAMDQGIPIRYFDENCREVKGHEDRGR